MDEVWTWIVVYAIGLALLQVLVYRYLWQRGGSPAGEAPRRWHDGASGRQRTESRPGGVGRSGGETRPDAGRSTPDESPDGVVDGGVAATRSESASPPEPDLAVDRLASDSTGRICSDCGAENEPDETFSHCWNCASRLG
jgi:hypothetical protein